MISGRYSQILNTSDVPFDEDLKFEIEGNSSKQQRGPGPYYEFYCGWPVMDKTTNKTPSILDL